jgi:hypothetical protein
VVGAVAQFVPAAVKAHVPLVAASLFKVVQLVPLQADRSQLPRMVPRHLLATLDLLGLPLASQQMAVPDHAQCRAALRLITDVQEM